MSSGSWQPISSAPNDVEILVYTKKWGPIIARHSEEHDQWLSRMQVPVSLVDEGDMPSHWQDLPNPPEGHGADDDPTPQQPAAANPPGDGKAPT